MPTGQAFLASLPKSLTDPGFTSLRRSRIYLVCFLRRVPDDLTQWCMVNDVLPPEKMRGQKLLAWIAREQERVKCRPVTRQAAKRRHRVAPLVVLLPALPVDWRS